MKLLKIFVSLICVCCSSFLQAQNFIFPLDNYYGIAGNYGELRGGHFHCGLDLKTGGSVGKKVYAAQNGYISRLSVTSTGFGNMITINHPGGYQTIYGHLLKFAPALQARLRKNQYRTQTWEQSIYFGPREFPVKKGDFIAYSGNSGSSGGPHLHFEVRSPQGIPMNLLIGGKGGVKSKPVVKVSGTPAGSAFISLVKDTVKPVINSVLFFGHANIIGTPYSYLIERPRKSNAMLLPKYSYVAIDAIDYINGNYARLGIYRYQVFLDRTPVFTFTEGNIPYSTGKYITSLLEYSQRYYRGRTYVKSYLEPGNRLKDRIVAVNDGLIVLNDDEFHNVRVVVYDVYGNSSEKSFLVKRDEVIYKNRVPYPPKGVFMGWVSANSYKTKGFEINIPMGALYSSMFFTADTVRFRATRYSPLWEIGNPTVPMHNFAEVKMSAKVPQRLVNKAVLAMRDGRGYLYYSGGTYSYAKQQMTAYISSFGKYCVTVDTTAPRASFKFADGARIRSDAAGIRIGDNLSGVRDYKVEIDGHWVVAEFDAKNAQLNVPLADARIAHGTKHLMKVSLVDMVGNRREATRKFVW
jgi:murein DD-endopeptidase MepM/ murein hydrolase activator NlpD